jgi:hypothetical protein
MDDKEEKKGFWRSWMTITILLALTIMVAFLFSSHSPYIPYQNENTSIGNGTNVEGSTNIVGNGTNVEGSTNIVGNSTIVMDNDTFFKTAVRVNFGTISEDLNCISAAGKNRNFNETERCGKLLSENANLSLMHVSGYNVSHPLQTALNEYKNALEYYNIGGTKLEIGARNRDLSQMGNAIGDIQNGTVRINMVTAVLYGNGTYNTMSGTSNTTLVHPKVTSVGGQVGGQ